MDALPRYGCYFLVVISGIFPNLADVMSSRLRRMSDCDLTRESYEAIFKFINLVARLVLIDVVKHPSRIGAK